MTAQQYLLSQAEHCRRTASDATDPFVTKELLRLAETFEKQVRGDPKIAPSPGKTVQRPRAA